MQYTRVAPRKRTSLRDPRIYASLDELMRLQFKASGFSYLPRQPVHSVLSGRHASRLRGRGLNFEELRGYLPGDDIRTLDWKVTARTREPHVRVYTEERDRPVWLLIDQRDSMFFGSRNMMKSVAAAETAAVSAWRVLSAGDRVGAITFGRQGLDFVTPHRSRERVMQILRSTIEQNHALQADQLPEYNDRQLNESLARLLPLAKHDCLVVLVTDGFGSDAETTRHLSRLSRHNDVLIAFVYDPMEAALPAGGRLAFSESGQQLELDTSNRKLQADWAEDFAQRLERIQNTTRRHAIPLIPITTDQPVLDQVRDHLGHHQHSRRSR